MTTPIDGEALYVYRDLRTALCACDELNISQLETLAQRVWLASISYPPTTEVQHKENVALEAFRSYVLAVRDERRVTQE